jgi:hypothetical protein
MDEIAALKVERDEYRKAADDAAMAHKVERDALQRANLDCVDHFNQIKQDYDALRAKLAALEGQGPVAALVEVRRTNGPWQRYNVYDSVVIAEDTRQRTDGGEMEARVVPLYAAGAAPQAQPLTEGEIHTAYFEAANQTLRPQDERMALAFARAIEAAHGITQGEQQ